MWTITALLCVVAAVVGVHSDSSSINKRSHNHGPEWLDHCRDNNGGHLQDPFCELLTTTTTTMRRTKSLSKSSNAAAGLGASVGACAWASYPVEGAGGHTGQ